jgi:cell division protein FtsB
MAVGAAVWFYVDRRDIIQRYRDYQANDLKVQEAAEKTAALDEEVKSTQERVQNLHTNPLEMESAIRRAKGLVRPGEIVYKISNETNTETVQSPAEPAANDIPAPQVTP